MPKGLCPRCRTNNIVGTMGYCRGCANEVNAHRRQKRRQLFLSGALSFPKDKTCRKCGKSKPGSAFSPMYATKDGLSVNCKQCQSSMITKTNKRRKYGLDESALIRLLSEQGDACAICGVSIIYGERKNNFHIDHDHSTGEVRGVLCPTCNVGLGKLCDDPTRVECAISYLQRTERLRSGNGGAADS